MVWGCIYSSIIMRVSMWRTIVVSFSLFVCANFVQASSFKNTKCGERYCIAVVDAGSTGSRLHIYAYDLNTFKEPINIEQIWSKSITPGFASLEAREAVIQSYLNLLFGGMPEQNLPVYFYATAGMRLLSEPKQVDRFDELRRWFDVHPEWRLIQARTITGREEGVFAWLAINYQLGALTENNTTMAGVMDIGGASVQVAFPVYDRSDINSDDLIELSIYGRSLTLFTHSFLGLGQTVFSYQFLDLGNCFSDHYRLPSGANGHGDAVSCQKDVSRLVNHVHEVRQIVKPVIDNNVIKNWYILGAINSLVQDPLFDFKNNQLTGRELLVQANDKVCHHSWKSLKQAFPENDFLYGYCLFSSYYYALMVNGYGLKPDQPIHYLSNSKNSNWTLGVVLHQP